MVDGGMKTKGPGAMDADGLCPALLDERATTSLFAQPGQCWRPRTLTMIPTNNRMRNLKALCQRCHMLYDREEHRQRRLLTLRMRNAIGDLFLGLYRT
jgi:hypothetical protein